MRALFVLAALLIAYGSLYPFTVNLEAAGGSEWPEFLASWRASNSLGDLLGNVGLFVPFGYLGLAALRPRHAGGRAPIGTVVAVMGLGLVEAVGLQVAQIYFPDRVPRLADAIWNMVGLAIGMGVAMLPGLRPRHHGLTGAVPVPLLLVGLWLAYRLAPFVPSLDVQNVKDSLKPLLLTPFPINWVSVAHGWAGWLACGALWRSIRGGPDVGLAVVAVAAVFAAEVLVVDNVVTSADVLGALLALLIWSVLVPRLARPDGLAAVLLGAFILLAGLVPFELRSHPAPFEWLPFRGYLEGEMSAKVTSLLARLFEYGALVWLLFAIRVPLFVAVAGVAGLVAGIEAAQTMIVGRTPEITDPLLALLAGVGIRLWNGPARRGGPAPSA